MAGTDFYALLGVSRGASTSEIAKAYRRLALRHHPDKVPEKDRTEATSRFRVIALAYEVLKDAERREQYDVTGQYEDTGSSSGPTSEYDTFVESFFGESARYVDGQSADYSIHSLMNYDRLTLNDSDLPVYMRDIAKVGLNYLARVVEDLDRREVALLRHQRVDILYIMVAFLPPLTQKGFDDGYIIHYYDNPLQAGILPAWSDQNTLCGGHKAKLSAETRSMRVLSAEQYERRQQLAREALTDGPVDNLMALQEKYYYEAAPAHIKALRQVDAAQAEIAAPSEESQAKCSTSADKAPQARPAGSDSLVPEACGAVEEGGCCMAGLRAFASRL